MDTFYGVNPDSNDDCNTPNSYGLHYLDRVTGDLNGGKVITTVGDVTYTVHAGHAITVDPTTGFYYAVLQRSCNSKDRTLARIDVSNGEAVHIADFPCDVIIETLAFDIAGQLYGVTDENCDNTNPESLYKINKLDGSVALVKELGNGDDGEVIAYNPLDNRLYHWSGDCDFVFESINLNTPSLTVTTITTSKTKSGEITGAVWDPIRNNFLVAIRDCGKTKILVWNTSGVIEDVLDCNCPKSRGFALFMFDVLTNNKYWKIVLQGFH